MTAPYLNYPQTMEAKSYIYDRLKKYLNVGTIEELEKIPWDRLHDAYQASNTRSGMTEVPGVDCQFLSNTWLQDYSFPSWSKKEIIIGDCNDESAVLRLVASFAPKPEQPPQTQILFDEVSRVSSPTKAVDLLESYQVTASSTPEHVKKALTQVLADICFHYPAELFAKAHAESGGVVYRYLFDEQNPFESNDKGTANHSLEMAYLFGCPSTFAGVENEEHEHNIQNSMQEKWIKFAYGEQPWRRSSVYRFGPQGEGKEIQQEELKSRRRVQAWVALQNLSLEEQSKIFFVCYQHLLQL